MTTLDIIATQHAVEQFLIDEADLLDTWQLDEWLALFEDDCRYEVGPLGLEPAEQALATFADTLFIVSDDRWRLQQRVEMLKKPSAHIEWPHSRTRHMIGNVKITGDTGQTLTVRANLIVFRSKRGVTNEYMGQTHYTLARHTDGTFRISSKRVDLDLDGLVPQGKVSIIL